MDKLIENYVDMMYNTFDVENKKYISSLEVAEVLEKEHKYLLRDIRLYEKQMKDNEILARNFFLQSEYPDNQGKPRNCYKITKQGYYFIGNKFVGEKGTIFAALWAEKVCEKPKQDFNLDILEILKSMSETNKLMTSSVISLDTRIANIEKQTLKQPSSTTIRNLTIYNSAK